MEKVIKINVVCMMICMVVCMLLSNREVLAKDIYGILTKNNCIEILSEEHEIVKLKIYKEGLYALKTSGENDVVVSLFDKDNQEVVANYRESDNNYYATYFFKAGEYNVNIKIDKVGENIETKLWLVLLDKSLDEIKDKSLVSIDEKYQDKYFRYVPSDTDTYMIRSVGKMDLSACVYNEEGILVDRSSCLTGNDFKIVKKLDKDKCYYVRVYSENDVGSFKVEVRKAKNFYSNVINLEIDSNLNRDFEGYIKEGKDFYQTKFIPNVDGEFEFVVVSGMDLKIDVLDGNGESVTSSIKNNKNYSVARAFVKSGEEYVVNIVSNDGKDGIYKLKVLNFSKLTSGSDIIVLGDNQKVVNKEGCYFKFRCPKDGRFNFELVAPYDMDISLYNENGKFIKKSEACAYVNRPTIGVCANKDDVIYVRVQGKNITKENIQIVVSNFSELIKNCTNITEGETYGKISEGSQWIVYKFVPQRSGVYTIKSTCKLYIDGKLYNKSGDVLSENNANDMKFRITWHMEEGEVYYIKVTNLYTEGVGEFSIDVAQDNVRGVVAIEEDIGVEDELEYVGDAKKYSFNASDDNVYAVNVISDKNMHMKLYNDNGVLVDGNDKRYGVKLEKDKDYTIEVSGEDSRVDIGEYSFLVENFTKKVDDAQEIVSNVESKGNLIMSDTKDYYTFCTSDDACYSIYTTGDIKTYIMVYDMECKQVCESRYGIDSNAYAVARLKKGQKYLIEVSNKDKVNTGIYGLVVKKNDKNMSVSKWLRVNELTTGIIKTEGDIGHYKVIVKDKGKYVLSNYGDMHILMDVYDKNKKVVKESNDTESEECSFELEGNSLYYINVRAGDEEKVGMYNFKLENLTRAYENARCLVCDVTNTGEITTRGQCDYYKFIPSSKGEYVIIKTKGCELNVDILDMSGKVIVCSDNVSDIGRIFLSNNKVYYIRIRYKSLLDIGEYEFFIMSKSKLDEYATKFLL